MIILKIFKFPTKNIYMSCKFCFKSFLVENTYKFYCEKKFTRNYYQFFCKIFCIKYFSQQIL